MLVGAGGHPAVQVARSGDGVGLQHLWDQTQVVDDVTEPALGDLQVDERRDLVAEAAEVQVGAEAGDDAPADELVQPGLDRSPGDLQPASQLEDACPGRLGQLSDEPSVQPVDRTGQHAQSVVVQPRQNKANCPVVSGSLDHHA